jgi:hypothetical protein
MLRIAGVGGQMGDRLGGQTRGQTWGQTRGQTWGQTRGQTWGSDPGTDLGSDPGTDLGSDPGTDTRQRTAANVFFNQAASASVTRGLTCLSDSFPYSSTSPVVAGTSK